MYLSPQVTWHATPMGIHYLPLSLPLSLPPSLPPSPPPSLSLSLSFSLSRSLSLARALSLPPPLCLWHSHNTHVRASTRTRTHTHSINPDVYWQSQQRMLCHIIIHAMSHHHTCYVTSSCTHTASIRMRTRSLSSNTWLISYPPCSQPSPRKR